MPEEKNHLDLRKKLLGMVRVVNEGMELTKANKKWKT